MVGRARTNAQKAIKEAVKRTRKFKNKKDLGVLDSTTFLGILQGIACDRRINMHEYPFYKACVKNLKDQPQPVRNRFTRKLVPGWIYNPVGPRRLTQAEARALKLAERQRNNNN